MNEIEGIWYYMDKKTDPKFNGDWKVEMSK